MSSFCAVKPVKHFNVVALHLINQRNTWAFAILSSEVDNLIKEISFS